MDRPRAASQRGTEVDRYIPSSLEDSRATHSRWWYVGSKEQIWWSQGTGHEVAGRGEAEDWSIEFLPSNWSPTLAHVKYLLHS